jgi:hypothetical protein
MSGASALAAAKRRRAVPADPPIRSSKPTEVSRASNSAYSNSVQPNPVNTQPMKQNQNPQNQNAQNQNQQSTQIPQNPLNLLLQHEQKINELQTNFSQLKLSDKQNILTPDTLDYFKKQHELMNLEIHELKKILIKVQTFSMETNLEVLKMKKQNKIESNDSPTKVEPRMILESMVQESIVHESDVQESMVQESGFSPFLENNEFNYTTENI